jgi:hypothetical protein
MEDVCVVVVRTKDVFVSSRQWPEQYVCEYQIFDTEKRFYSVAVITSGSDCYLSPRYIFIPGDPGSIPGKTFRFAHLWLKILIFLCLSG